MADEPDIDELAKFLNDRLEHRMFDVFVGEEMPDMIKDWEDLTDDEMEVMRKVAEDLSDDYDMEYIGDE